MIYRFNTIPTDSSQYEKHNPKMYMEPEETQNTQSTSEQQQQTRRHHNPRQVIIKQQR